MRANNTQFLSVTRFLTCGSNILFISVLYFVSNILLSFLGSCTICNNLDIYWLISLNHQSIDYQLVLRVRTSLMVPLMGWMMLTFLVQIASLSCSWQFCVYSGCCLFYLYVGTFFLLCSDCPFVVISLQSTILFIHVPFTDITSVYLSSFGSFFLLCSDCPFVVISLQSTIIFIHVSCLVYIRTEKLWRNKKSHKKSLKIPKR